MLAFPIADTPQRYTRALGRLGELKRDKAIRAAVEGLQPYNRGNPPGEPPLWLLRELNDADKHRIVNVSRFIAALDGEPIIRGIPPKGGEVRVRFMRSGPFEDGARLLGITTEHPALEVNVEGEFPVIPAIRYVAPDGTVIERGTLWVLARVRDEVAYCLDRLATFLP